MMMTNIFPSAEVSHFKKWLKTKDWSDVCVCEISTAGLNSHFATLYQSPITLI